MNMKNLHIIIAMLAMAAGTAAHANSLRLDWGAPSSGVGGEFVATVFDGPVAGVFSTWCVQTDVYFNPGGTYNYQLVQTDSTGRNLSLGTAWLYNQFLNNALTPADGGQAQLFQSAIWYLQGGQIEGGFPSGGTGNMYYDDAAFALGSANLTNASQGAYGVWIMQMYNSDRSPAQAQLARVPDGGMTIALLGGALLCLAALRRRFVA